MRNRRHLRGDARAARHGGLTLIELLVAITILSFIAILGWRGLDSIVRARIALTNDLEQTRGMQLAFAQLQSDCAHLANSTPLPDRMPLIAEKGRLSLVRTVFADNQPSRLQVVTYRVKDGVLTRHESAATRNLTELGAMWRFSANDTGSGQEVTLQAGVTAMTMRLWISGDTGWRTDAEIAQRTAPTASAASSSVPLTGLEVTMQLQGRENSLVKIFLLGAV